MSWFVWVLIIVALLVLLLCYFGGLKIIEWKRSVQNLAHRLNPRSWVVSDIHGSMDQSGVGSSVTLRTGQPFMGTTRLSEKDHNSLCEYLNKHAAHWRTIGQYLGFLPGELDNIQHTPTLIVGGPVAYLSEMLAKWLQWAPGDGRGSEDFATLEALKHALNKAGFGVTITELTMNSLSIPANFSSISEYQQHVVVSRNDDTSIIHQSHETTSWVIGKTMKEANIEPIQLSAYDEYAIYLRGYYTRNRQSDDKWPHLGVRKYIRLAVVSNEFKSRMDLDRFRKSTIHGSIDHVLKATAPIELSKIFNLHMIYHNRQVGGIPLSQGGNGGVTVCHKYEVCCTTQVLIEGAPGIGKSTMSWEICERWARGELFTYFSMVLLLKFRDKWVQDAKCLSDLFGVHYRDHEIQYRITRELESTQGRGLLLILEGYDEAPALLQSSESIFLDLFTGKLLPKATVVITTRSSASSELRHMCRGDNSRRIEVLGFGAKEISEYIHSSFTEHVEQLPDFKQYLKLYPHIHSMMYVPLNSAIVTYVYQECKSTSSIVPKTMTQLYSSLIRTLLLRYLKEHSEYKRVVIRDFIDLKQMPGIYEQFLKLCEIAYSGIMKAQTELIFSDLPGDFNTLGLMQSCPELYIDEGESYSYNFLHLTIQEFLAAYHISLFDEDKFESEIEKLAGKPIVMKFLVGLCQSKAHFWRAAIKPIPVSSDGAVSMSTLHLLFEAHDLSAYTVLEHGSCIASSASTCTWEIDFSECQQIGYGLFVKGLVARSSHVKSTIILKHISDDGLYGLSSALESTLILKCLHIIAKRVESERAIQGLLKLLEQKLSLEYLNLDQSKIRLFGAIQFAKILQTNCTLKHLDLNNNDIADKGAVHLAKALETNSTLEHLDLSNNAIQNEGAFHLAMALEKNSTLKHFDLSDNAIQNEGVVHLVKALEKNLTLQYFDLSDNVIQNEGSRYLAKANFPLKYLRLSYNSLIPRPPPICLAKIIEMNSTLKHLDLSNNAIQNEGAIHLAKALEKNSTLMCLDLSNNAIQNEGAIHLAKALEKNSTLICLNLSGNAIQKEHIKSFRPIWEIYFD